MAYSLGTLLLLPVVLLPVLVLCTLAFLSIWIADKSEAIEAVLKRPSQWISRTKVHREREQV